MAKLEKTIKLENKIKLENETKLENAANNVKLSNASNGADIADFEFVYKEDDKGRLTFLGSRDDSSCMNWAEGRTAWGTVICPEGIRVEKKRQILNNKRLEETYRFTNATSFPVMFKYTDVGIYTTFNDNYEAADECLERRCHTHIFCGGEASYVQALRMGGRGPHLGLALKKGSITAYSVERDEEKRSDDRGDFILHPDLKVIGPGETAEVIWELFWFEKPEDFIEKLMENQEFPVVKLDKSTYFPQENLEFEIRVGSILTASDISVTCRGKAVSFNLRVEKQRTVVNVSCDEKAEGEYKFDICVCGKRTWAVLYRCADLRTMSERRCRFIAEKQQYGSGNDSDSTVSGLGHLTGAYLIYDREQDGVYYSHLDDHNGGRERLGMGALMAVYLQKNKDDRLFESLMSYKEYVYRELFDKESGMVFNDICRNNDWNRLYNYPWMSIFLMELYRLTHETEYIHHAFLAMIQYYEQGGDSFYAIGIPACELLTELENAGFIEDKERLKKKFLAHADVILHNGIHYPASEVQYEQSIVAPAVSILLQAEAITQSGVYLREAKRQMKVLELFNGAQPDYHQFSNAIRHWDGFWFGKNRTYGDTFPHYWSVLSGVAFAQMAQVTHDSGYEKKASASIRGSLNLFKEDGFASCAMVYPLQVNGRKTGYYDPWANDQDWALYYALKYENIVE
ncbi:hypothetical protein NXH76_01990 [Blautia schinkii]|nr:hypothetical protein [Blautia schinkii]